MTKITIFPDGSTALEALRYIDRVTQSMQMSRAEAHNLNKALEIIKNELGGYSLITKTKQVNPDLLKTVDELELSVRAANYMKNDDVVYVGDLVLKSEEEIRRTPNVGRRTLNEIKELLYTMGLSLGMDIPNWPPENVEELANKELTQ